MNTNMVADFNHRERTVFRAPTRSLPNFFKFNKSWASIVWRLFVIFEKALWASFEDLYSIRACMRSKSRWNLPFNSGGSKIKLMACKIQIKILLEKNQKSTILIELLFATALKSVVFQCNALEHVEFQSVGTHNSWWNQFLSATRGFSKFDTPRQLHF